MAYSSLFTSSAGWVDEASLRNTNQEPEIAEYDGGDNQDRYG
jgi:hypothetical protein